VNVLLITFSFPPAGGVGVLRALSLAKYLPQNGVRVDVLAARNAPAVGKDLSLLQQVPSQVTVHRTWTLDLPFALRKGIKKLLAGGAKTASQTAAQPTGTARKGNPLKRLVSNLLLPDPQIGWLPFAFPAARRIIRSRQIDAVLITVPPFSSARLVTQLRREFPNLPIILDFRDEWLTTTINLVSFNSNQRAREVAHQVEGEAVRDATAVVAVTQAAQRELRGRYPGENPEKFLYVANGFESRATPAVPAVAEAPHDSIVLTYMGTVYGSTDPSNFVQAALSLAPALREKLRVRFVGHVETPALRATLEQLGDTVDLVGFLPQAAALQALESSDYLLLITHDHINVSAKFYDYLASSKPIIAAVHPDGDVRRLLEETGAGVWADVRDPNAIAALLTGILIGEIECSADKRNHDRIAQYDRRVLATQYALALQKVTGYNAGQ
jgi:glycosyltransferase involved in cell wall biosynthesis